MMSLTSSLHALHLTTTATTVTTAPTLTTTFLHGTTPFSLVRKPSSSHTLPRPRPFTFLPTIRAMKSMQGRVVCSTSDKTVSVEVTRLAPHPKYKRRVRKKEKYQAHDPDNQFEVGDFVQLEKCRPISKSKTFLAVPVPSRNRKEKKDGEEVVNEDIGIPLESSQQQEE